MSTITALRTLLLTVVLLTVASSTNAQTATYHLHKDASATANHFQILPDAPDAATFAISSQNLKNVSIGEYTIKSFDTPVGLPNLSGVLPANSTITYRLWLKKSSTSGVMYPRVKLLLTTGGGVSLGTVTGTTALTSTLTLYTLTFTTSSPITIASTDRFDLWVGVNVTTAPTTNTNAVLNVEGTLNGNYDSYFTFPLPNAPPTVSMTSPVSGSSYSSPSSITLGASASDSDGINKVEFFEGTTKLGESTTSPYTYTWNNPPPASFPYSLTARAIDNAGLTKTSTAVSVTVTGNGSLFNSAKLPSGTSTVNLTSEGTSDWAHWGLSTASSFDRKSGVTAQVSNYTRIGTGTVTRFSDSTVTHQWSDGTPNVSSTGTTTGISVPAVGNGFQITVPADTTAKTLRMYVAVWYAQARMEATLSDGSAPAIIDTSFGKAGLAKAVFTINFKAASAGQTLTVKYTVTSDYNAPFGNVALESSTLSLPATGGSGSLTGSVATPPANVDLQTEGAADWSHWGHGSVSGFNRKSGVTSEISFNKIGSQALNWLNDNPTAFSWTGGTPTASATNTRGGIYTFLVNNGFQITVPADTEERTLKLYTGLWRANARLEATLSDGSAASFIDTSLSNNSGTSNGVYSITFKAASPGQSLRVRYTNNNLFDPSGNVTLEAATLRYSPPSITNLSTNTAQAGSVITISGSNFGLSQGSSTISFNGVNGIPTTWNSNTIVVPIPANATSGPVVATVRGVASNGLNLTVIPPLAITNINPVAAPIGDNVTINGTSFGATQDSSTITFNGTTATPTNWSNTSIVVPVPVGAQTGPVVVTVGGVASNSFSFGVAPKISSISTPAAAVGQPVVISGTSFGASQGTSTITFNGVSATATSWSANSITVPVPSGATSGNLVVTVGGLPSNGHGFIVTSHINTLSPTSGAVGDSITVTGTNFGATQGTSTITFNGTAATISSWSDTSIVVTVPAAATSGPVITTVAGIAGNAINFTVFPKIIAIDPASGAAGEPVTITGTTFGDTQGTSTIKFNGVAASPTSWSATSISVPVPTTTTTGLVIVTVNGNSSNGVTFNATTTVTLSGKVTVAGSTNPIPGAAVKALQGNTVIANTTTNGSGDYAFNAVSVGTYSVEVSASGYGNKRKNQVNVVTNPTTANIALDAIISGPVNYVYDSVGRLVSTVGPTETVIYSYDATGNLLSISRQPSTHVSVLSFTPASGTAGTSVTINGTGFSATAAQNTVQFNGTTASVTSANPTKLVVTVPAGATTGQISVTSPGGSDTSDGVFTIGTSSDPTITSFSPSVGAPGDAVTITGTNFQTSAGENKVKFTKVAAPVTSANSTTIGTSVPFSHSGKITVGTPFGNAVSTADFFITPAPYLASEVENAARMTIGSSHTLTVSTPGKIAMVIFDGVAGQRISIKWGPGTCNDCRVHSYRPDYSPLKDEWGFVPWGSNQAFTEPFALPVTGTYTILIDPNNTITGSVPLTIYDVPPDITGSISIGGPTQTAANTVPGQNVVLSFTGTQGQEISLRGTGATVDGSINIRKPDGTDFAWSQGGFHSGFIDKQILPVSGTYTIILNIGEDRIGSINITLYDATDLTSPIVVDGPQVSVATTVPGQNVRFTFEGTTGQRIFIHLPTSGHSYWLRRPDGTLIAQASGGSWIDTLTLDTTGTFTLHGDPDGSNTGTLTARIYSVPADLTGEITINAAAIPVAVPNIGQNYNLTFEGAAGQPVTVRVAGGTIPCVWVKLLNSSGTILTSAGPCTQNFNLPSFTLPAAGAYTIQVDPSGWHTGAVNLSVTNP